jgi:hypothetical protein
MSSFYRKSTIEEENNDLIEYSNIFWNTVLSNDFQEVEDMISEDCRLQDALENSTKGFNGCKIVLEKLVEIQSKTSRLGLDMKVAYCKLMRNKTQTRYILKPRVAFKTVVIGIALDWECGIIVSIVMMRDTKEHFFMNDNTIAPITIKKSQNDAIDNFPVFNSDITELTEDLKNKAFDTEIPPDNNVVTANDKKWYPGKFIKKVKTKNNKIEHDQVIEEEIEGEMKYSLSHRNEMLAKLLPPFLFPKPPLINPTIIVTVIGCTNLKSRLNRIVTRPINSYVKVYIGKQKRCTNIVDNNPNPTYIKENFLFELNPNNEDQYVVFKVQDKHVLIDEDLLAEIKLPLVSLKSHNTSDEQQEIILPLSLKEKRFGKGINLLRKSSNNELSTLIVKLTKVDIMQWWMMEELRMRDELSEKLRIEEEIKNKNDLKNQEIDPSVIVSGEINTDWVENNNCNSCNILFSLTIRKHHCRVCGGIFWYIFIHYNKYVYILCFHNINYLFNLYIVIHVPIKKFSLKIYLKDHVKNVF